MMDRQNRLVVVLVTASVHLGQDLEQFEFGSHILCSALWKDLDPLMKTRIAEYMDHLPGSLNTVHSESYPRIFASFEKHQCTLQLPDFFCKILQ